MRVFGTTTAQLNELVDWLVEQGVESVAMESTSVYWIPLYELLESRGIEAVLVNARQLHNVPGRKTDCSDCQWLQLLHSCGLLRGSFRPGDAIVRLRAVHRQRANLVYERTRCVQWMQKALDQMNVQVHRAVTDLTGDDGDGHRPRHCGRGARPGAAGGPSGSVGVKSPRPRLRNISPAPGGTSICSTWPRPCGSSIRSSELIASYDARVLTEMAALAAPRTPRSNPSPRHPNPDQGEGPQGPR